MLLLPVWLMTEPLYFTQMCIDTKSNRTEVGQSELNSQIYGHFSICNICGFKFKSCELHMNVEYGFVSHLMCCLNIIDIYLPPAK